MSDDKYFSTRLAEDHRREVLWRTLCEGYFNKLVKPTDHVLELGAGYALFINNIGAERKTAVDLWPGLTTHAAAGIDVRIQPVSSLDFLASQSVDFVFASNLFEHLTQPDFAATLAEIHRVLRPEGTLNILQPNYRRVYREYFDDYTHVSVYSDVSLADLVSAQGFDVIACHPGLLPLTIKSKLPVSPALIRLYLALPWKPMGKQMFLRARPRT